jgi:hypothetical protein
MFMGFWPLCWANEKIAEFAKKRRVIEFRMIFIRSDCLFMAEWLA